MNTISSINKKFGTAILCQAMILLVAGTSHAISDLGREYAQREVQKCHKELQSKGIASEIQEIPNGNPAEKTPALLLSTTGDAKVNRLAADALKNYGVQIYLSSEMSNGSLGLFVSQNKAIYLSDCESFTEDVDILQHEIMHAKMLKDLAPETSDIYFGSLKRKVPLQNSDLSGYVTNGTSLGENYTFAYQIELVNIKAPHSVDRLKYIAKTGLEISQFSVEFLSELLRDLESNPDVVSMIGVGPREALRAAPGAKMLLYIMENSNYRLIGYVSGKDTTTERTPSDRIELLKKSLQNKVRFYQELTKSWISVNEALAKNDLSQFVKTRKILVDLANKGL